MQFYAKGDETGFTTAHKVIADMPLPLGCWRERAPSGCALPSDPPGWEVIFELPGGFHRYAAQGIRISPHPQSQPESGTDRS